MDSFEEISSTEFSDRRPEHMHPWHVAATFAGTYMVLCLIYIRVSGIIAVQIAGSKSELLFIELLKGSAFVIFSAAVLYVLIHLLLHRVRAREAELAAHRQALIQSQQRAAAGLFAASVAHDLNNALTVHEYASEELQNNDLSEQDRREILHELVQANRRMRVLTRRLMNIGHKGTPGETTDIDLRKTVQHSMKLLKNHKKVKTCTLKTSFDGAIPFHGNPAAVSQLVTNLVLNAADATGGQGRIHVSLCRINETAELVVEDDGPGIPEGEKEQVFDPFFTTKKGGNGLGLMTVKACASEHGGDVLVDTSELGGARFKVRLPLTISGAACPKAADER